MARVMQIIFPPQFEPFQPYLSGPYLKALIEADGARASVFDANIDFYGWQLIRSARRSNVPSAGGAWPYLGAHATQALDVLKGDVSRLEEYRWAINVLDELLRVSSPPGTSLDLTFLKIGNHYSSADLRAYLLSSENVFAQYFEENTEAVLGPEETKTYLLSLIVIDQLGAALTFANEIRRRRPNARVIVGGSAVSRLYRQLRAVGWICESFDAILPGEAYRVLPPALGLPHRYSDHARPNFSDLDLDRYWSCRRVLPYLVAHGCKWGHCTFCSHHLTYDGYRASAMEVVLDDIESLSAQHRAEYISFCDEHLTPCQLGELSEGLLRRGIDVRWSTFARPEPAFRNQEFVQKLYAAGCRMLMFGLESASQRVINAMRKGTRVTHFRAILEACKVARIATRCDFMIGFPGETEEDVQATLEFIRENRDVLDTPFSSYSVAVFELRSGISVESEPGRYRILSRDRLRGDLDDQYEFECEYGLSPAQRVAWRERLIQHFKLEMDAEIICPQNKTHQLILKDLYDRGLLTLPVLRVGPDELSQIHARLAPGVETRSSPNGIRLLNHANGGELALSPALAASVRLLAAGTGVDGAFAAQRAWGEKTFCRFVDFLYRNEYVRLDRRASARSLNPPVEESAYAC